MTTARPSSATDLLNPTTIGTTLALAVIFGAVSVWQGQAELENRLDRIEEKVDEIASIVEAAHPRRITPPPVAP